MNQRMLVKLLSEKTGETGTNIEYIIEALANTIGEVVAQGEKVSITKLGTFKLKKKSSRSGYDPYHDRPIEIPPRKTISFDLNKSLKEKLKESQQTDINK